jgi:hypothetical protein
MFGFHFVVFTLAAMILDGCGSTGPQTPIWERENSPAPVVESNVSGAIVPLRSGDSERLPTIDRVADRALVRKLTKQLARYGRAEFTTNSSTYLRAHA